MAESKNFLSIFENVTALKHMAVYAAQCNFSMQSDTAMSLPNAIFFIGIFLMTV